MIPADTAGPDAMRRWGMSNKTIVSFLVALGGSCLDIARGITGNPAAERKKDRALTNPAKRGAKTKSSVTGPRDGPTPPLFSVVPPVPRSWV